MVPRTDPNPSPQPSLTCHKTQSLVTQSSTIQKIASNPDLVIKPFDKGSGICLTDTYTSEMEKHIADPSTLNELDYNPTQVISNDDLSTLDFLYNTYGIDDKTR